MAQITLNRDCKHRQLVAQLQHNKLSAHESDLVIEFGESCRIYPCALSTLCAWALQATSSGLRIKCSGRNTDSYGYVSRMDLFQHTGLAKTERRRRLSAKGRFMPLKLISSDADIFAATNALCDLVIHRFDDSASFLTAMEWAVNEMLDNIRMHANAKTPAAVCAQYYSPGWLMIGISDTGQGIRSSLSEAFELASDTQAIETALQRGVTRSKDVGQGNGLAGTKEIAFRNQGTLSIWSGDAEYVMSNQTESFTQSPVFQGTCMLLALNSSQPVRLQDTFIGASSWNYFDVENKRVDLDGGLMIKNECVQPTTREAAKRIRRKINSLLPHRSSQLTVSFEGVSNATSSFLDELFGRLAEELGETQFRDRIKVTGMSNLLESMTNVVIHQRLSLQNRHLKVGQRVFHSSYGKGIVHKIGGKRGNVSILVDFSETGRIKFPVDTDELKTTLPSHWR